MFSCGLWVVGFYLLFVKFLFLAIDIAWFGFMRAGNAC